MANSVVMFNTTGTFVGKVNATDRDQEGTDHVLIRYSLLSNTDLFAINSQTGDITLRTDALDRQVSTCTIVRRSTTLKLDDTVARLAHLIVLFTIFLCHHIFLFFSLRTSTWSLCKSKIWMVELMVCPTQEQQPSVWGISTTTRQLS